MSLPPDTITCPDCTRTKRPDEFSKDASKPTGRDNICKLCRRVRMADYRARRRAAQPPGVSERTRRIQAMDLNRVRQTIPAPTHDFGIKPHGVVRYGKNLYRVLTVNPTHVQLANGEWVLRHLVLAA